MNSRARLSWTSAALYSQKNYYNRIILLLIAPLRAQVLGKYEKGRKTGYKFG